MREIDHEKEINRYLNNLMTSKEIMSFLQHVATCSICSSKLEQIDEDDISSHGLKPKKINKLLSMAKWIIIAICGVLLFTLLWWLILYITTGI